MEITQTHDGSRSPVPGRPLTAEANNLLPRSPPPGTASTQEERRAAGRERESSQSRGRVSCPERRKPRPGPESATSNKGWSSSISSEHSAALRYEFWGKKNNPTLWTRVSPLAQGDTSDGCQKPSHQASRFLPHVVYRTLMVWVLRFMKRGPSSRGCSVLPEGGDGPWQKPLFLSCRWNSPLPSWCRLPRRLRPPFLRRALEPWVAARKRGATWPAAPRWAGRVRELPMSPIDKSASMSQPLGNGNTPYRGVALIKVYFKQRG